VNILGANMESTKQDVAGLILNSPKAQAVTASLTTGIAIDYNVMSWLPQTISIVGGVLGIVLTTMMIVHKGIQIKKDMRG